MPSPLSALCVECGLCCDGSLFRFLPVAPEDVPRHAALALPVVTQSGRPAMPLPCTRLSGACCTVYEARPPGCRAFVCALGDRLARGVVSPAQALGVVREAQARIARLRRAWPGRDPVVQRATHEAREGAGLDGAALEALQDAHAWLDAHLHWPDGPIRGT